jgi:purine nucleoside permease
MRFLLAPLLLFLAPALRADPIPVRVAVVVTFEVGKDRGDQPGEFQFWAEREPWSQAIAVPGLDHPVLTDGQGTIGVVAGTTGRAGQQLMALVLSGLFDFTRTYWIINGIAGVNPAVGSLGSAAWAHWVIDGDVAYELDARDADPAWPYAIMPIGSTVPNQKPQREGWEPDAMAYRLNGKLVDWAFALTRDTALPDSDALRSARAGYAGLAAAQRPPFVFCGESFGSSRFWHGAAMTRWAVDWTRLWTDGQGSMAMSDMEDQGFAAALRRLQGMHRVDFQRVLVLRTASNYCEPPPHRDANRSLHAEFAGYRPALEAAYRVGSAVSHELAAHWDRYRDQPPSAP